jgi:glycosyltransferase involved in cell wall biosynthesis
VAALISVIVTTYNREDALAAVLRSLARQSDADFEAIVADDGSGPATAELIAGSKQVFGGRLTHVWHEDRGFRAAEIRNRAVLAARGDYVVFLDGDCLVRSDFVAAHRALAAPGWFVTGNRVLLSEGLTGRVLSEELAPEAWGPAQWLGERVRGGVNRLSALIDLPLGPLRGLQAGKWRGARSCNLAVWRADLVAVDGFDAAYAGWGREDSDLVVRLLRAGVRRKDGRFATGVIHLWHREAERAALAENERRLERAIGGEGVRAVRGLSALTGRTDRESAPARP